MSDTSKTCCHFKKRENIRKGPHGPPDHEMINLLKLLKKQTEILDDIHEA